MYESVRNLWKQYCAKTSAEWVKDDPRHDLSSEVRERLTQLDLILEHVKRSLASTIDPEWAKRIEWFKQAQPRLVRGEITAEEYEAGLTPAPRTPEEDRAYLRAWSEVRLFTEIFYFVAWRLRQAFNSRELRFPNLRDLEAKGIRDARLILYTFVYDLAISYCRGDWNKMKAIARKLFLLDWEQRQGCRNLTA
jgi:hypothetical protein